MSNTEECPSCGNRTITERGITITHADGTTDGGSYLHWVNCEWDDREAKDEQ